jgi:hypothetical protein
MAIKNKVLPAESGADGEVWSAFWDLLKMCWEYEPENRPSVVDMLPGISGES